LILLILLGGGVGVWWWATHSADKTGGPTAGSGNFTNGPIAGSTRPGGRRFGGANAAQPVSVQAVRRQDMRVMVNAIGSMAASNNAVVHAQVSGVLQSLNFKEGEQVR
ncbi:MdtA/MuxA family multidrug efflux RND transporter periplasmic adaptor subunit, partial [Roseateles sp. GG27B]